MRARIAGGTGLVDWDVGSAGGGDWPRAADEPSFLARTGTRLTVAAIGADTAGLRCFLGGAEDFALLEEELRAGGASRRRMRPPDLDFLASAVDW